MPNNTILDDIAAVAGVRAALIISTLWVGNLYIPPYIAPTHKIAQTIGMEAATNLAAEFGSQTLAIPSNEQLLQTQLLVLFVDMVHTHAGDFNAAGYTLGWSNYTINNYIALATDCGLLDSSPPRDHVVPPIYPPADNIVEIIGFSAFSVLMTAHGGNVIHVATKPQASLVLSLIHI